MLFGREVAFNPSKLSFGAGFVENFRTRESGEDADDLVRRFIGIENLGWIYVKRVGRQVGR